MSGGHVSGGHGGTGRPPPYADLSADEARRHRVCALCHHAGGEIERWHPRNPARPPEPYYLHVECEELARDRMRSRPRRRTGWTACAWRAAMEES